MITLAYLTTTLTLPADLLWSDEHDWHPVEQAVEYTITGAMIVDASTRLAGRPITLQPEDDASAWISLPALSTLETWAATPGRVMALTIRGTTRNVMFRHHDTSGMTAKPVLHVSDTNTGDFYLATIKLMEVGE